MAGGSLMVLPRRAVRTAPQQRPPVTRGDPVREARIFPLQPPSICKFFEKNFNIDLGVATHPNISLDHAIAGCILKEETERHGRPSKGEAMSNATVSGPTRNKRTLRSR
jgi:hypothetical protein